MITTTSERQDREHLYTFKVVVIGDSGVGKSNLLSRFTKDQFTHEDPTIGVELNTNVVNLQGKPIQINFWDTAGQERYRASTSINYRKAAGALIVYDISHRKSFTNVDFWLRELQMFGEERIVTLLVGNKCDLESSRAVSRAEAQTFADAHDMMFVETSALESTNVESTFRALVEEIYRRATQEVIPDDGCSPITPSVRLSRHGSVQQASDKFQCC
ncbi:Ras-related protein Rab-11B [Hypsibius exemplaris]|uniref:Ras-related protein Rab-11B n=1 Tax=Hypsibius exemplaris TaxID=2072580 RepID=A0A1W0WYM8_HYPEX|nr:Ras-related protein Rab-11B [Hypsibius exemplaris]